MTAKPKSPRIGIIAPSSMLPKIEFEMGVEKMRSEGWSVEIHPYTLNSHWLYSETDEKRAEAFLEFAFRKDIDVLWCGRGGYGATHLLPLLEKATRKKKPSKKALFGYSDATALMEFVRTRWGWKTFHSPMPSLRTFSVLPDQEWNAVRNAVLGNLKTKFNLQPWFIPKGFKSVQAPLVGGNLAVWNALIGTPFAGNARGKILLIEEVSENIGRINRMLHHLSQSGGLKGVKALVLGDFVDCNDTAPSVLKGKPSVVTLDSLISLPKDNSKPIREVKPSSEAIRFIFEEFGKQMNLAVFAGVPVGHGENQTTVQLGGKYSLSQNGKFESK